MRDRRAVRSGLLCYLFLTACATGHNLEELDLRKKYSINVIAVKDGEDIRVTVNPKTLLRAEEVLILIGENKELAKLMKNRK